MGDKSRIEAILGKILEAVGQADDRGRPADYIEQLAYVDTRYCALSVCVGCVDKKDSPARSAVIQAHLYMGDELGTQPDVRRRMGIL
ncbi:hypothetical protein DTW92_17180 [Paracoccus pantotrophus]|uniref:hypothetical protein n=1 Tax=Paracoccus pantotrophus TaxID=82367 RepID=UPI000E18BE43|nr:hypothetical protein [Paracoccus pantotrophus]RDD94633.1 hypothetical protein DTW92_17180 [Paracoccus pantotrophus]